MNPEGHLKKSAQFRALFFGGLLPLIAYTAIEEMYGVLWGLVAGMALGVGEIVFEKIRQGRVENITWIANGLILAMGGISLFTGEGIWFKLQPAIIEFVMAVLLVGSVAIGKPFFVLMADKQKFFDKFTPEGRRFFETAFSGLTFRVGVFFFLHALLAVWAALYWSTRAWAILKGVGFTASMILYLIVEIWFLRKRVQVRS